MSCKLILCEKQSFNGVKKIDTKVAGTVKKNFGNGLHWKDKKE